MENKTNHRFFIIYTLGALLTLALAVIATWADLEASFYGFDRRASMPLKGLRCPILMNRNETGVVSITVANTADKPLTPAVRAEFSTRLLPVSNWQSLKLAAGESRKLEWAIGSENIDLERFVFSKVLIYASYPLPDREATCGTFIVDLPVPGNVLLILWIVFGVAGMGGGLYYLNRSSTLSSRELRAVRPIIFLAALMVAVLVVSLAGWWVQAILLLAVTTLLIVITLNYVFLW
jgi:hypothetical protein